MIRKKVTYLSFNLLTIHSTNILEYQGPSIRKTNCIKGLPSLRMASQIPSVTHIYKRWQSTSLR